jgi:hypothetical protein
MVLAILSPALPIDVGSSSNIYPAVYKDGYFINHPDQGAEAALRLQVGDLPTLISHQW